MSALWKLLKVEPTEDALRFGINRVQYPWLVTGEYLEGCGRENIGRSFLWRLPNVDGDYDWSEADLSACAGVVPFGDRPGMEHKGCGGRLFLDRTLSYPRQEPSDDPESRALAEERFASGRSKHRYGEDLGLRCALCRKEILGDPAVLLRELEEE